MKQPKRDGKERCKALTLQSSKALPLTHPQEEGVTERVVETETSEKKKKKEEGELHKKVNQWL